MHMFCSSNYGYVQYYVNIYTDIDPPNITYEKCVLECIAYVAELSCCHVDKVVVLLCSHVENAGHIGALVITNCQGSSQGTKRIVAVTGDLADEVMNSL